MDFTTEDHNELVSTSIVHTIDQAKWLLQRGDRPFITRYSQVIGDRECKCAIGILLKPEAIARLAAERAAREAELGEPVFNDFPVYDHLVGARAIKLEHGAIETLLLEDLQRVNDNAANFRQESGALPMFARVMANLAASYNINLTDAAKGALVNCYA